jgi:hypothetical protein
MHEVPTMSTRITRAATSIAVLVSFLAAASTASAQRSRSAEVAKQLGEVMDRLKLESIAAPDAQEKDRFAGALYFPGSTLLVVAARYAAPSLLVAKMAKKEFRDIYIDLNSASISGTKVFVMDHNADGLVADPGNSNAPDTWEEGTRTLAFDGDGRAAKMSEQEYAKAFAEADERYARILTLLLEQARKGSS